MVVHFTAFETSNYGFAVFLANMIGGKRYHTKSYGGGIVFQSYSTRELATKIRELLWNTRLVLIRDKAGYTESDARIICAYEGRTKRKVKDGWKMFFDGNFVEFLPKIKYEFPK